LNENITSALYWEYDSRIGRRWNIDPEIKPYISSYSAFANNPIWFMDVNGDDSSKPKKPLRLPTQAEWQKYLASKGPIPSIKGKILVQTWHYKQTSKQSPNKILKAGGGMILTLTADDVTGVGTIDDVAIPLVCGGTIIIAGGIMLDRLINGDKTLEPTPYAITWDWVNAPSKPTDETIPIPWTIPLNPPKIKDPQIEYLYELKAASDGVYPVYSFGNKLPTGWVPLKAGQTWKYGTSIDPDHRYTMTTLLTTGKGLTMQLLNAGGATMILTEQKSLIMTYTILNGKRPPGNKINN
jgi:hypothetical protein